MGDNNNNNNCAGNEGCLARTRNRFHNLAYYLGINPRTARNQRKHNKELEREAIFTSPEATAARARAWEAQRLQAAQARLPARPTLLEEQQKREEKRGYDTAIFIATRILENEYQNGKSYTAIRFIGGKLGIPGYELPIGRTATINQQIRVRNAEEAKLSDMNVLNIAIGIITKIQTQVRGEINTIPYGQKHLIAGAERAFAHINTIYDDITERLRVQEAIAQRAQMTQMQAAQQEQMAAAAAAEAARAARDQQAQYAASAAAMWAPSSSAQSRRRDHSPPRRGGSKKNTRKAKKTRKIRR